MTDKIVSIENLKKIILKLKLKRKKIVLCHGVFDLLHIGHIKHFNEAKKNGDILVVTITPDIYVNKGPSRPSFNEELRLEAIASLSVVNYVALNSSPTAVTVIEKKPSKRKLSKIEKSKFVVHSLVKILKYNKLTLKGANIPKNGNEKILDFLSKTFNKSNPSNSIILSRTNNPITLNKKDLIIIINKILK